MILSDATAISLDGREVQEVRIDGELVWTSGLWIRLSSDKSYVLAPETATITVYSPDLPSTSIGLYMVKDMTRTKLDDLTTDENGQATYTYTGTGAGEIGLVAVYDDTDSNIVTIDDYTPAVTSITNSVNNNNVSYGDTVIFTAVVKDQHDAVMSGQTVTFKNSGTSIGTATTDSTGTATLTKSVLDSSQLDAGSYSVTAEISTVSSTAVALTVNKLSPSISITPPTLVYSDAFEVVGYLTYGLDSVLAGETVTLQWNDGTAHTDTVTTDSNGKYTFSRTAPTSITTYSFKVVYAGNTNFNSSETSTVNVEVDKETTILNVTAPQSSSVVSANFTVSGNVKTNDNETVTEGYVGIYKGTSQTPVQQLSLDSNGAFSTTFLITDLSDGTQTLNVKYEGTTKYSVSNDAVVVTKANYDNVGLSKTAGKQILSYADRNNYQEYCTVTAQLKNGSSAVNISGIDVVFNKVDSQGNIISQLDTTYTDGNGQASYSYDTLGAGDVRIRADVGSLLSESFVVHDYLWVPALDGTETIHNVVGTPSISNNELTATGTSSAMCSGYIGAFDNTGNWEITFQAQWSSTGCGVWLIKSDETQRDKNDVLMCRGDTYFHVNGSGTTKAMNSCSLGTYVPVTITKNGSNISITKCGSTLNYSSWSLLTTLSTLSIGVDAWNGTVKIKDIVVKPL